MAASTAPGDRMKKAKGFTLIELLVVLMLLAILAAIVVPLYMDKVQDAREVLLKQNLHETRKIIDQFYRDKQRYPKALTELVEAKYIRDLPIDPLNQRKDAWTVVMQNEGVVDLRSSSSGVARDGSAYVSW
jgi:general secretion pathway protein G